MTSFCDHLLILPMVSSIAFLVVIFTKVITYSLLRCRG
jgi:hypothetical protein